MIVLYAAPRATDLLRSLTVEVERRAYGDARFFVGRLSGVDLIFGFVGTDPAKSAIATQTAIREFRPDCIIAMGQCVGVDSSLRPCDLVVPMSATTGQGKDVVEADPGLSRRMSCCGEAALRDVSWAQSFRPRVIAGSFASLSQEEQEKVRVANSAESSALTASGVSCYDVNMYGILSAGRAASIPVSGLKVVSGMLGASVNPRYRIGHALTAAIALRVAAS